MSDAPKKNNFLLKLLIIFFVFPVLFYVFRLVGAPLALLAHYLGFDSLPGRTFGLLTAAVSLICGLGGAFWICWKIWPKPADSAAARESSGPGQ